MNKRNQDQTQKKRTPKAVDFLSHKSQKNKEHNLNLPYHFICQRRYLKAFDIQTSQFLKEVEQQERLQTKALDAVRIHREFSNTVLLEPNPSDFIRVSQKQKRKIEQILLG